MTDREQEPVAWRQWIEENPKMRGYWMLANPDIKEMCLPQRVWEPLYTHPAPDHTALLRQALELLNKQWKCNEVWSLEECQDLAIAIEKELK